MPFLRPAARSTALAPLSAILFLLGCSASSNTDPTVAPDSGKIDGAPLADTGTGEGGFNVQDARAADAAPELISTVYANTDDTLYKLDTKTKAVTKIGPFTGLGSKENLTDIAVDEKGTIWGVTHDSSSATAPGSLYELTLPSSDTGDVPARKVRSLLSGRIFYALGMAPKGVLETGEGLVGGDDDGNLWWIPRDGSSMPVRLGGFGTVASGQPGGGTNGQVWQLSGDIVFFSNAGTPVGLATVRPCDADNVRNCKTASDVVVEIDMTALAAKASASLLRKRFLDQATGFGRLYGVGAWDQELFAFSRGSASLPASLVSVSLTTGVGTKIADFAEITNGWSGAGVSTSAKISIPK